MSYIKWGVSDQPLSHTLQHWTHNGKAKNTPNDDNDTLSSIKHSYLPTEMRCLKKWVYNPCYLYRGGYQPRYRIIIIIIIRINVWTTLGQIWPLICNSTEATETEHNCSEHFVISEHYLLFIVEGVISFTPCLHDIQDESTQIIPTLPSHACFQTLKPRAKEIQ